ncbi:TonB-dependent receptor [Desulfobacter hydrogenophilus]|uniref:TonB-dependent receptor n=1 Tax=Desulfobacter hydrogenophilus TaxID=2291 RepID=A0A328F7G5_9BACT|nr:TonB-dependent receptor [Desulfobacter hydrogenophilus]NDY73715.1 TonB-dependent receptor [Desulfobacter hydrogenophilus]QBH11544.1 TonB-dependent receptor [Desulfobacter hydrogenophilus]RAM00531.1 TonB-dependent receptor [Desulfobacter hydrogenophilus]
MKTTMQIMGLFILLFPLPLWAEVNISPTVVTATISEKTLEEAPGSVQVITALEIEEMGATSVNEVLEQAMGLMVSTDSGRAKVANIRGTGNKRSLVLIDGRRLAAGYKDFTSTDQIPVTMIQRIEIVRGPSCAIYGSDAIGGVVNIITKKAPDKTSGEVLTRYKSHLDKDSDGGMGSAWVGSKLGKTSFILSGSTQSIGGWNDDGHSPDDGDDKDLNSTAGRIAYALTDASDLSAGFEYFDLERQGERYYQGQSRERNAEDQRLNYFIQYDNQIAQDGNILVRAYRSEHENKMQFSPIAPVTSEEDSERWLNQVEARYTGPIMGSHLLSIGAEFRQEGREDSTGADNDLDNTSIFIQDEFEIFSSLYITAGLRYDDHSEFGGQFSPKASLVYGILYDLRLKASIGKGFRAPSISELFVTSYHNKAKYVYNPNPDLEPEESVSYEIGLEGDKGPFSGGITAFRNDIDNLIDAKFITTTGSGNNKITYYQYQNIAEAHTQGIEARADIRLPWHLSTGACVTWLDTENKETGEELDGSPDIKGIFRLAYYHPGYKFRAATRINYIGDQHVSDDEDKSGYVTVNLYFSKDFPNQIRIFAGIDNLLNEKKAYDGVTYVEPANAYAGLSIRF